MTEPLLEITRLQKTFGERRLFDIDGLRIDAGCAYALTGPNGAGKSTLLRVLAGLERADVGDVTFLGIRTSLKPYPRALRDEAVYVHQHPVMFSTSVEKNIAFGLATRRLSASETAARVRTAMEWAGIMHLTGAKPQTLSGGEKQRVALARAKVLEPKLLLLDEPTANLDGTAREQVIALIPELVKSGSSVILACHDRDLIAIPGMRRLKLAEGRLELRDKKKPLQSAGIGLAV